MSETIVRHKGVWRLKVTGPEALLNVWGGDVEVVGLGGNDPDDIANLEYEGCDAVARSLGYPAYDDIPEQYTPISFAPPELTTNKYVTPDGTQQWFVGVYLVDRGYGGPEEGGWWFDCGELVQQTAVNSLEEAEALRERLAQGEFPDTGKRYSVLSGEDYSIRIDIEPMPDGFPEYTPHYE